MRRTRQIGIFSVTAPIPTIIEVAAEPEHISLMSNSAQRATSEWGPFHIALFRALWFATLAANLGTLMQKWEASG